ncbi:MAG: hypothetical protein ACXWFX_07260 [Methylobacter sp.]
MDKQNITLQLSAEEINLLLEALGSMPFVRVYNLIGKIQQQASGQLSEVVGSSDAAADQD